MWKNWWNLEVNRKDVAIWQLLFQKKCSTNSIEFSDQDSGNDAPEFLMWGVAAISYKKSREISNFSKKRYHLTTFFKRYIFIFSDHDSGNDEPEFLLRGAAAIVDLEKQLSRGDESEQEQENIDDQHALVIFFLK